MKIFADGADIDAIVARADDPSISGFTTNPTLMRKSGVADYEGFGRKILEIVQDRPVSFEVFSDEPAEMVRQGLKLAAWGPNVYVKIPVTTTTGRFTGDVISELSAQGVHLNVTALLTCRQVELVVDAIEGEQAHIISVFAGRIADTGRDPIPMMQEALAILAAKPNLELLWASPREVLNLRQAESIGVHIITVTEDLLAKRRLFDRDLDEYSLETVRMFHDDAAAAGFLL